MIEAGDLMNRAGFQKWALWAALALGIGVAGQAAEPVSEKILAERLKLYASVATLEVSFKQLKTLKDLGLQLKSEGRLKLQPPNRVVWEILQPSPVQVTLDQNEIRIRSGKGADAQVQTFKMSEAPSDPSTQNLTGLIAWLTLDSKALAEQYMIYAEGSNSFRFIPKQKGTAPPSTPFKDLFMTLSGNGLLKHLTIDELSGDTVDIDFGTPKITHK
jgi:outer membrane lipoprotein-sorting protein